MLSKLKVQHYKSLFDTEIDLEPLTVFIGPNGSGKSNICESLFVLSSFLQQLIESGNNGIQVKEFFVQALQSVSRYSYNIESKFWHGKLDYLSFGVSSSPDLDESSKDLLIHFDYPQQTVSLTVNNIHKVTENITTNLYRFLFSQQYPDSSLANSLKKVSIYDFAPTALSSNTNSILSTNSMDRLLIP
jgi:AAA15 family ATPase/GTPase